MFLWLCCQLVLSLKTNPHVLQYFELKKVTQLWKKPDLAVWIAYFPLIHIWMSFKCNLNWIIWVYCACFEKIISSQSNHNILVKLIGESHAQRGVRNCSLSNQGVASRVILQESVWTSVIQYFHLTLRIEQTLLTFADETWLWEMICTGRYFRGRVCSGAWRCSPVFLKE